jgi:2-polyprenyl-3-methyl-5-hydroxy-6-metoxy-1,4-benzoquinol methylase
MEYKQILKEMIKEYNSADFKNFDEVTKFNIRVKLLKIARLLGKGENKTLLEAGGGGGYCSWFFAKMGFKVVNLDIHPLKNYNSEEQSKENFFHVVGNLEKTNFKDNQFDVVVCLDVIEHLDAEKALNEIKRVLKPGGIFILTTTNGNSYYMARKKLTDKIKNIHEGMEHYEINYKKIKKLLNQYFNIIYKDSWCRLPIEGRIWAKSYNPPFIIDKLLPKSLGAFILFKCKNEKS